MEVNVSLLEQANKLAIMEDLKREEFFKNLVHIELKPEKDRIMDPKDLEKTQKSLKEIEDNFLQ